MITALPAANVVGTEAATGLVPAVSPERVAAFEATLARNATEAAGAVAPPAAGDPAALERARQGLGLDAAGAADDRTGGDVILDGLSHLRGIFDTREARVSDLMGRSTLDAGSMMAIQMELVNFTLLVDMTSKLTGKSTQVFDTLMKGQ